MIKVNEQVFKKKNYFLKQLHTRIITAKWQNKQNF